MKSEDMINPAHYKTPSGLEAIDVLLSFFASDPLLWSATKYLLRCGKKGDPIEDLEKAKWFINKKIEVLEND